MTGACDLHMHSTASDGQRAPAELAAMARAQSLELFSLTDHDTLAGLAEADAASGGMRFVPGVELSTDFRGQGLHLLVFWGAMGRWSAEFEALLAARLAGRRERLQRIAERLEAHGVALDVAAVLASADGAVTRAHIATQLIKQGSVASRQEVFDRWIGQGKPAFVPSERFPTEEAIATARAEGGLPVVAHPGARDMDRAELAALTDAGLGGVEVFHACHGRRERSDYRRIARELGLVVTGGSDYHGGAGSRLLSRGEGLSRAQRDAFEAALEA